jgi:hypothetical protein
LILGGGKRTIYWAYTPAYDLQVIAKRRGQHLQLCCPEL